MTAFLQVALLLCISQAVKCFVNFRSSRGLTAALLTYQEQKGNIAVPRMHTLLEEPSVQNVEMRRSSSLPGRNSYLERLLLTYQDLHGNMLVPQSFIVPQNDASWPTDLWGIKLGSLVHNLRSKYRFNKQDGLELLKLGFSFHTRRPSYKTFKSALLRYEELYGNMLVPHDFMIPTSSVEWSQNLWDLELGYLVNSTRKGAFRSHRKDLVNIGFQLETQKKLKGFARFKAAVLEYDDNFGNMLVPLPFVIPSDDANWSEEFWGMRLGSSVRNVRSSAVYCDHIDELKELGFSYEPQSMSFTFETLKTALYEFQDIEGNMMVPISFVVPKNGSRNSLNGTANTGLWPDDTRGIRLGRTVSSIRYNRSYIEHRDELERIGFNFTPRPKQNYGNFELTKNMLLTYKEKFGDLKIDVKYIVPRDMPEWPSDWPEQMHGQKLGKIAEDIITGKKFADKKEELLALGFDYENDANDEYIAVKSALQNYKELYGDLNVPCNYIIPMKKKWPKHLWNMRLGNTVDSIRGGFSFMSRKTELLEMGFDYDSCHLYGYDLTKKALLTYKFLVGNMLVDRQYVIPTNSRVWPEEMWGFKLGEIVWNIRRGYSFRDKKEDLQKQGFLFCRVLSCEYLHFKNSLLKFKDIYGDLLIPRRYVLPTKDVQMCEDMYSLNLGYMVDRVRSLRRFPERKDELAKLGFDYNTQLKFSYEFTKSLLIQYKAIHGNFLIHRNFVVPYDDEAWPEEMRGQKLGRAAESICRGNSYSNKKDDLSKIGFEFIEKSKRYDYECVKIAIYKYRELNHGSSKIPGNFEIPEKSSWYPEETWGMPLGSLVARIRGGLKWPSRRYELLG